MESSPSLDFEASTEIAQLAAAAGVRIELQEVSHRSILGQILIFVVTEIGKEVLKLFAGELRERLAPLIRRLIRRPQSTLQVSIRTETGSARLDASITSEADLDRLGRAIQGLLTPARPAPQERLLLGPDGQWQPIVQSRDQP